MRKNEDSPPTLPNFFFSKTMLNLRIAFNNLIKLQSVNTGHITYHRNKTYKLPATKPTKCLSCSLKVFSYKCSMKYMFYEISMKRRVTNKNLRSYLI